MNARFVAGETREFVRATEECLGRGLPAFGFSDLERKMDRRPDSDVDLLVVIH